LFFLSFRDFAANSFVNLLAAGGILVWSVARLGPIDPLKATLLAVMIGVGFLLRYLVRIVTIVPVFWWHSGRGLELVFWHMTRFIERPDRIFTGAVRTLLTTILPFALMASYPARVYLEAFQWSTVLHVCAVTGAFFLIAILFWRAGLRAYSSASS
jgi:ABC-2 type transport system permease protein